MLVLDGRRQAWTGVPSEVLPRVEYRVMVVGERAVLQRRGQMEIGGWGVDIFRLW